MRVSPPQVALDSWNGDLISESFEVTIPGIAICRGFLAVKISGGAVKRPSRHPKRPTRRRSSDAGGGGGGGGEGADSVDGAGPPAHHGRCESFCGGSGCARRSLLYPSRARQGFRVVKLAKSGTYAPGDVKRASP